MRLVSYQMHTAKFPVHRDLAGFDFECSPVDKSSSSNWPAWRSPSRRTTWVLVGGPGTGKTHLATAIGVAGITRRLTGAVLLYARG